MSDDKPLSGTKAEMRIEAVTRIQEYPFKYRYVAILTCLESF